MIHVEPNDWKYLSCALPSSITAFHESGYFDREIAAIDRLMAKESTPDVLRKRLTLQRVIAQGMKREYPLDFSRALALIRTDIPDFTEQELSDILEDSVVDWHMVNGQPHFQDYFRGSLYDNRPDLSRRAGRGTPVPACRDENAEIMQKNGSRAFRFRVRCSIKPVPGAVREGESVLVHLPYPLPCEYQSNIVLHDASPDAYISGTEQRTVSFRAPYRPGDSYFAEFSYTMKVPYRALDPQAVSVTQPSFYTEEHPPQILFTPYLCALAKEIAGGETNPLLLARRVYEYITTHTVYSFVREYLLIENIPEACLLNRFGDCGVMALAFITLCRILGIPARWQSGLSVYPDHIGPHDWAEFYVAPYGWLFCDPSHGVGALRAENSMRYTHYFGNLDPFRMITCRDIMGTFDPPKKHLRIDPYDNQFGEIECDGYGLRIDQIESERTVLSAKELLCDGEM